MAYFIDGLSDYHLKAKILRENPATFRAAVTCATNEQNVQDRIQLILGKPVREKERVNGFQGYRGEPVRQEEPMEVGHMRPLRCFKCGGKRYILSFVDHYTGWPEAFALPEQKCADFGRRDISQVWLSL